MFIRRAVAGLRECTHVSRSLAAPARIAPAVVSRTPNVPASERWQVTTQQVIFDRALKRRQRNAAARLHDSAEYDYLRDHVAIDIVERLNDITREFPIAADIGCHSGHIARALDGHGDVRKLYCVEAAEEMLLRDANDGVFDTREDGMEVIPVLGDEEWLPFRPESLDLVMSCLSMHWVNDLPGALKQVRQALKPDGAFIGAMFGGDTLGELRSAFVAAELERLGGVSPRMSPMVQVSDVGNLLSQAGFRLPTVDSHTFTVNFSDAFHVMEHLQGMAENGALMDKPKPNKELLLAAAAAYQAMYGNPDGTVPATFQVVFMIGWAPHESQQKPLARGSAEFNMKDMVTMNEPEP